MIIFSNTTPFIALSAIQQLDLMPALFGKVYVVDSVIDECAAGGAIQVTDLRQLSWITAVQHEEKNRIPLLVTLDLGERETIETALSHQADLCHY